MHTPESHRLYIDQPEIIPQSKWAEYSRRCQEYEAQHSGATADEITLAKQKIAEDLGL